MQSPCSPCLVGWAPPMATEIAKLRDRGEPLWIFAYGSLLWDRHFGYAASEPALLRGYHRSFCLYSYDYRGTPARPGLTLGLDRGGSCRGMAFRLPAEALDQIWLREMSGRQVYEMRSLPVRTSGGGRQVLAFVVLRDCPDYTARLSLDDAARIIFGAAGRRGTCRDYLASTIGHLEQLGIVDRPLRRLAARVEALAALSDEHGGF
jgi:glutathione-specific gamma-glutamylcyclotransferase